MDSSITTNYQESISNPAITTKCKESMSNTVPSYKITLIGHSYVRRLMEYRQNYEKYPGVIEVDGKTFQPTYVWQGGKDYAFFNKSNVHKDLIIESRPDLILVVLGGNAVASGDIEIPVASRDMRSYFFWLQENFPNSLLIAAEVEPRYDGQGPPSPDQEESHWERRNAFNQAVYRLPGKDFTHRVAKYLNHRNFYTFDGVHFSNRGNHFYWGMIKDTLSKVIKKFDL